MSELIVSRQQQVLLLTLNRPAARNALNNALLTQLVNELEAAATDSSISVCVITGNARFFAAGADLNEMAEKDLAATLNDTRPQLWGAIAGLQQTSHRSRQRLRAWCGLRTGIVVRCGGCRRERAFWFAGNHSRHHARRRRNATFNP